MGFLALALKIGNGGIEKRANSPSVGEKRGTLVAGKDAISRHIRVCCDCILNVCCVNVDVVDVSRDDVVRDLTNLRQDHENHGRKGQERTWRSERSASCVSLSREH